MNTQKNYKITQLELVDSTNSYALKNIADLSDREVIIANKQSAGKGRLDREWVYGGEDNVYLSIILKPCNKIDNNLPIASLTHYMSVVLCRVLENYDIKTEIKWPNDVLVNKRKIAGLLSQVSVQGENFKGLVLGVGVNLNMPKEQINKIDQPATSLNLLINKPVHRDSFVEALLDSFFENYNEFLNKGFTAIKKEYTDKCSFLGQKIAVQTPHSITEGTAQRIMDDGSLAILDGNLQEKIITMGDIICF